MNKLDKHTMFLIANWNSTDKMVSTEILEERHWWEIFKIDEKRRKSIDLVIRYLLESMDDFVSIAIKETGVTEESIIDSIGKIYDSIVILPLWLKFLSTPIRNLIVRTAAPVFVDFLFAKYNEANQTT